MITDLIKQLELAHIRSRELMQQLNANPNDPAVAAAALSAAKHERAVLVLIEQFSGQQDNNR